MSDKKSYAEKLVEFSSEIKNTDNKLNKLNSEVEKTISRYRETLIDKKNRLISIINENGPKKQIEKETLFDIVLNETKALLEQKSEDCRKLAKSNTNAAVKYGDQIDQIVKIISNTETLLYGKSSVKKEEVEKYVDRLLHKLLSCENRLGDMEISEKYMPTDVDYKIEILKEEIEQIIKYAVNQGKISTFPIEQLERPRFDSEKGNTFQEAVFFPAKEQVDLRLNGKWKGKPSEVSATIFLARVSGYDQVLGEWTRKMGDRPRRRFVYVEVNTSFKDIVRDSTFLFNMSRLARNCMSVNVPRLHHVGMKKAGIMKTFVSDNNPNHLGVLRNVKNPENTNVWVMQTDAYFGVLIDKYNEKDKESGMRILFEYLWFRFMMLVYFGIELDDKGPTDTDFYLIGVTLSHREDAAIGNREYSNVVYDATRENEQSENYAPMYHIGDSDLYLFTTVPSLVPAFRPSFFSTDPRIKRINESHISKNVLSDLFQDDDFSLGKYGSAKSNENVRSKRLISDDALTKMTTSGIVTVYDEVGKEKNKENKKKEKGHVSRDLLRSLTVDNFITTMSEIFSRFRIPIESDDDTLQHAMFMIGQGRTTIDGRIPVRHVWISRQSGFTGSGGHTPKRVANDCGKMFYKALDKLTLRLLAKKKVTKEKEQRKSLTSSNVKELLLNARNKS